MGRDTVPFATLGAPLNAEFAIAAPASLRGASRRPRARLAAAIAGVVAAAAFAQVIADLGSKGDES